MQVVNKSGHQPVIACMMTLSAEEQEMPRLPDAQVGVANSPGPPVDCRGELPGCSLQGASQYAGIKACEQGFRRHRLSQTRRALQQGQGTEGQIAMRQKRFNCHSLGDNGQMQLSALGYLQKQYLRPLLRIPQVAGLQHVLQQEDAGGGIGYLGGKDLHTIRHQ